MTDWSAAVSLFVVGILGVMLVMAALQITIQVTSVVIRLFEGKSSGGDSMKPSSSSGGK